MIFSGYDAFDDPYAYKGTTVLKNRLGTRDQATLDSFELEMTTLRAAEPLPRGRFGPAHYRAIHHHIFQDVYLTSLPVTPGRGVRSTPGSRGPFINEHAWGRIALLLRLEPWTPECRRRPAFLLMRACARGADAPYPG